MKPITELTTSEREDLGRHREALKEAASALETAIDNWNQASLEAHDYATEVRDRLQAYYDGRIDKWRESQNGRWFKEWLDPWEAAAESHEDLDVPPQDVSDTLEAFDGVTDETEVDE